jgi:hypothetical protein
MRKRTMLAGLVAVVVALASLLGTRLYPSSNAHIGLASPDSDLACAVRSPDCLPGEVEVFRMSALANAHAGTVASSTYTYKVCCEGPAGLSGAPTGCYATVLTLSAGDNAHAASDGSYGTGVTLSAPDTALDCVYDTSCDAGAGYTCVASVSGSANAHVADCVSGYATKVCCRALPDANSDTTIGNGASIPGHDSTVANGDPTDTEGDACETDGDADNDGIADGSDPDPGGDITYDDNGDGDPCIPLGSDAADDGPSWDADCTGVLDGVEAICPLAANPNGDDDGDGLLNTWEVCKWGTNPNVANSDGDGLGDCIEVVDTNGDGLLDFGIDALNSARATLLPPGTDPGQFGKDGDFDLNGNNVILGDFGLDTLETARFALGIKTCQ